MQDKEIFEFGPYRLDSAARVLLRGGELVRLTPKVLDTLLVLVENAGKVVSKEELLKSVWPDAFVEESNLAQNVSVLRKALGSAENDAPRIETIPKRGYRFVTKVRRCSPAAPESAEPSGVPAVPPAAHNDGRNVVAYGRSLWRTGLLLAAGTALLAAATMWLYSTVRLPEHSQWRQLTGFPDPVSQPALSRDGRMLAFIRSPSTFFAAGEVYVKSLPEGEPRQLTHDSLAKTHPVFSPDGKRIVYTTLDSEFNWDTWVVSIMGGEPQRWLRNVSDLVWTDHGQILFSERPSKAIVAAAQDLSDRHTVYRPPNDRGVARRPAASPDGKWVLLAELNEYGDWEPCRVVPMDGSSPGRQVGPPGASCTSATWSTDGQWMYLTSKSGGLYHIWRQRFPLGEPSRLTSGPTEEEGVAIGPQSAFLVTAVALQNASVWLHSPNGEREISQIEGNAAYPKFTPDGTKVCYRVVREVPPSVTTTYREVGDLWIADLASRRSYPLALNFPVHDYDVSPDSSQVVMEADDAEGAPRLWLAPIDGRARPHPIPNVEGRQAVFGPAGEIFFRHTEGKSGFVYCVHADGTGLRRVLRQPILAVTGISPDGEWIEGWAQLPVSHVPVVQLFPVRDGRPLIIGGNAWWQWSRDGRVLWMQAGAIGEGRSYLVPLSSGQVVPQIPPEGFRSEDEVARLPGARRIDATGTPGPASDTYAFERRTILRNLYRIPIP